MVAEPSDETTARAGHDDRRCRRGHAAEAGGRAGWIDIGRRVLERLDRGGGALAARRRDGLAAAAVVGMTDAEPRDRQQRRDLARDARGLEERLVDARHAGMTAARLAVGEVAGEQPALLDPKQLQRPLTLGGDHALDPVTAAAGDELLVFLAQLAPGPEESALDDRLGHPQALADLGV